MQVEVYHIGDTVYRRSMDSEGKWSLWEEIAAPMDEDPFGFLKDFRKVLLQGEETIDERRAYVLILEESRKSEPISFHTDKYIVWIDQETLLPTQAVAEGYWGDQAKQTIVYLDFGVPIEIQPPR